MLKVSGKSCFKNSRKSIKDSSNSASSYKKSIIGLSYMVDSGKSSKDKGRSIQGSSNSSDSAGSYKKSAIDLSYMVNSDQSQS